MLSGASDGGLWLWNTSNGEGVKQLTGHTAAVADVAVGSGDVPISASSDKTVRFWNIADAKVARTITTAAPVTALATADGTRLAAATADGFIALYQTADGKLLQSVSSVDGAAHGLIVQSRRRPAVILECRRSDHLEHRRRPDARDTARRRIDIGRVRPHQ